jgi:hypothetical protein
MLSACYPTRPKPAKFGLTQGNSGKEHEFRNSLPLLIER